MKTDHLVAELSTFQGKVIMESAAESTQESNNQIKELPADQCPSMRYLEALDGKISDRREQMELCAMILNDLLEIQKIVAARGLENASLRGPDN